MASRSIFKTYNLYLVFTSLLSAAMNFAPLAFAVNYESFQRVTIYGAWATVGKRIAQGGTDFTVSYFYQLPLNFAYVLISATLSLGALFLVFYNSDLKKKRKWVTYGLGLLILQVILTVLIRVFASVFLADIVSPDNMESGFMREVLLHLFLLYFIFRGIIRIKKEELAHQEKA